MGLTMPRKAYRPTILIVEDEEGPRNALKVILRPFFNLCVVESGQAAMMAFREQPIDLVTLDLKLPDCQGVDLLREIKQERDDVEVIIFRVKRSHRRRSKRLFSQQKPTDSGINRVQN